MPNAVRQAVAWDCRKRLNVAVVMLRVKKYPAVLVSVLSSVGMFGEVAISGLRSVWARICARVVAKGQYAPNFFNVQCTYCRTSSICVVYLCILYVVLLYVYCTICTRS